MFLPSERQAQRHKLLETATTILQQEGPAGLSLRHIAQEAQTSTQMIYTLFGGKDGLIQALYEEGFARLEQVLGALPYQDDRADYLRDFLLSYRGFAHSEPLLYEIMFGRLLPQFEPPMADSMRQRPAYTLLLQIVTMFTQDKRVGDDPKVITDALWMAAHGALRMELQGFYADDEQALRRYELTINALIDGLLSPRGAKPRRQGPQADASKDFFTSI